jgi:glycosyltransferase 2 family protein
LNPHFRKLLNIVKRTWVALFAAAAIAFMYYVFRRHSDALSGLANIKLEALSLAALAHVAFWGVATFFWQRVVFVSTGFRPSLTDAGRQLALVAVGKYVPGKVWGFLARGAALKKSSVSSLNILSATIVEQWVMLMSCLLICGICVVTIANNPLYIAIGVSALAVSLFGHTLFHFFTLVATSLLTRFLDIPNEGSRPTLTFLEYAKLTGLHSLMWLLLGCVVIGIYHALFTLPPSPKLAASLILANTIGIVVGFAAIFAPGGLGVREATSALILAPILGVVQAGLVNIAFRLWITMVDMLLAALLATTTLVSRKKSEG